MIIFTDYSRHNGYNREARMGGCGIIPLIFIYMAPATNKYIVYITVVIIRFVIIIIP
jgi:hypothetical protein